MQVYDPGRAGFTGATLYMSMKDALKIVKLAFPKLKTIGIVTSDDENGIAHMEEAKKVAASTGMTVLSKQVNNERQDHPAACRSPEAGC